MSAGGSVPTRSADPTGSPGGPDLRRVRLVALALLGLCGGAAFLAPGAGAFDGPELPTTPLALGVAVLSILLRHAASAPRRAPETRGRLAVGAVAAAGALGVVGVLHAWQTGEAEQALLFVLAGAIFAVAPMAPAGTRQPPGAAGG